MLTGNGHDLSGPTANRPTNAEIGQTFYDTTTGTGYIFGNTGWEVTGSLQLITIPIELPALANNQVVQVDPLFAGVITQMDFRVGNVVGSTAGGATLTPVINGATAAGSSTGTVVLSSTNCSAAGLKVTGSTCAGSAFTAGQAIGASIAGVTAFLPATSPATFAKGVIELHVQRTS